MPQINKPKDQISASQIKENKLFRERLRDRYQPSDYVRVINIDNEPYYWQFFPSTGEEVTFTDNGAVRVVTGRQRFNSTYDQKIPGNEQQWMINPGDTEVIIGENADLMIEGLYKKLVVKKRLEEVPSIEKTQARNFNWNDGLLQEQMIDKIFLGIEKPNFDGTKPTKSKAAAED